MRKHSPRRRLTSYQLAVASGKRSPAMKWLSAASCEQLRVDALMNRLRDVLGFHVRDLPFRPARFAGGFCRSWEDLARMLKSDIRSIQMQRTQHRLCAVRAGFALP